MTDRENKEARSAIAGMAQNMDMHLGAIFVKAKLCRGYYMALIKEGFTEQEALELSKYFKLEL